MKKQIPQVAKEKEEKSGVFREIKGEILGEDYGSFFTFHIFRERKWRQTETSQLALLSDDPMRWFHFSSNDIIYVISLDDMT